MKGLQFFRDIKTAWKSIWSSKIFRAHFFLTVVIFAVVAHYCTLYISTWEIRRGTSLLDPLLNMLTPRDFSVYIFCILHSAILLSLFFSLDDPKELLKAFQAYSLLLLLRTSFIYFIPLEAPKGMIYLEDPFVGFFLNSVHVVTKDLFFSGHISSMFLFIYFSHKKFWRTYLKIVTPILAALLLWQHVHYTVDIIAAPFFAFICCKLIDVLNERWEYGMGRIRFRRWQYR
ncbi:MAG: hypothetical protein JWN78_1330 [Bacteroidota bacterium]|nr:hypothetical protein [Bacteroidota bacterium]